MFLLKIRPIFSCTLISETLLTQGILIYIRIVGNEQIIKQDVENREKGSVPPEMNITLINE